MTPMVIGEFNAGWVPSDDALKGRKNGLLRMESVELDQNGALVMCGGSRRLAAAFTNNAHTIYSKVLAGTAYVYAAQSTTGDVVRDLLSTASSSPVTIISSGSTTRAAFASVFDSVLILSGTSRKRDSGAAQKNLGRTAPASAPTVAVGAAGPLTGDYEYCQINVYASGGWVGKSSRSPISLTVSPVDQVVTVTGVSPTAADADANESWIFRRGGTLDEFYRIKRLTSSYTTPFSDDVTDTDAIEIGIRLNAFLTTVASGGISDDIVACEGSVNGRMAYFTKSAIYLSEVNSPDTYDSRTVISFAAATGSETFLFAKKCSQNLIIVGTTKDIYALTGTFQSFPDGTLDVSFMPLSMNLPPIGIEAQVYEGGIVYMTKAGPVLGDISVGHATALAGLNTDVLYRGKSAHGYSPATRSQTSNYTLAVANNKLFVRIPTSGSTRIEVYDFLRKSWRTVSITTITNFYANEDGSLMAFDTTDKYLKLFDDPTLKTLDNGGTPAKQAFAILTLFQDGGAPYSFKTPYALKFRGNAGGGSGTLVEYAKDNGTSFTTITTVTTSTLGTTTFDLSTLGDLTNLQFRLSGSTADFVLEDLEVLWEVHPEPTPFLHFDFVENGLDSPFKKKVATLPMLINTFSQFVTFTPIIDGVEGTQSAINTNGRLVAFHQFLAPIFGIKYSGKLQAVAGQVFEFWKAMTPEVLQTLPMGVRFAQLGPKENHRYSALSELQLRVFPLGTEILVTTYFEDLSRDVATITVEPLIDAVYILGYIKTIGGSVLRIELSSDSVFHVLDARVKGARRGRDTDQEYFPLVGV